MFVLICATLFFSVRASNADTGASVEGRTTCQYGFCITLSEAEIRAEAGLCVVIPCSFTTPYSFTPQHLVWYKCEQSKSKCSDSDVIFHSNKNNRKVQSGFKGRVFLLEPDVSLNNCSIIINDLTESDSGSYQLRVNGLLNERSDGFTFSPRATVSVKGLIQKPTVLIPPLTEGQQTTLTCTAPGLCSGSDPNITWTWRGAGEKDSHITGNITAFKTETVRQKHSSTLTFNPSAEHHGTKVTCKVIFTGNRTTEETVTLNVTYMKKPVITGNKSVREGETLNLTCSVESFPPSLITWTKISDDNMQSGAETNLQNDTFSDLYNNTESFLKEQSEMGTFSISNVTTGDSGQYICTAKHPNKTWTEKVDVTVILYPKILKSSACRNQAEVLTCVCISEGFPLPTIRWPLLKNHTEYSVINTVSKHTVNSSITLTVKEHSSTSVECVSSNENGDVKRNLITNKEEKKEGLVMKLLRTVSWLETIIAFFIGILLAAVVCCLVRKCNRKKQPTYGSLTETLEMVTSPGDRVVDAGQAVEDDQAIDQGAAEGQGAVAAGKSDVEYSNLDFSRIKGRSSAEAKNTQGAAESEYAEIKKGKAGEMHDGEGKEEEEEMTGKDEEARCCADEKEGEDVALYSTVKDVMDEI